jgi:hypothetical protein
MRVGESIRLAIKDFCAGERESAVLHACNAVDGTGAKAHPGMGSRRRFVTLLRTHYWLLEPMVLPGINLDETRFDNITLSRGRTPELAEIVYEVFRCGHAHGEAISDRFGFVASVGGADTRLVLGHERLHLPDRLTFGLVAVAVLHPSNAAERVPDGYFFSLADEVFPINEWWARVEDFRAVAGRHTNFRLTLHDLDGLSPVPAGRPVPVPLPGRPITLSDRTPRAIVRTWGTPR